MISVSHANIPASDVTHDPAYRVGEVVVVDERGEERGVVTQVRLTQRGDLHSYLVKFRHEPAPVRYDSADARRLRSTGINLARGNALLADLLDDLIAARDAT